MTATRSPHPGRTRSALAALLVGTCSTLVLAAAPGRTAAAATATPVAAEAPVVYEPGAMDSSTVSLGGTATGTGPSTRSATGAPAPGTTGWTTTVPLLPGTEMAAVSWDGGRSAPDGAVSVRSRGPAGWTPWATIASDVGEGGDPGNGRVGTDVIWLGADGADALDVRVEVGPLVDLDVLRMRYQEGAPATVAAEPEPRSGTTRAAARPTIRPPSAWSSGGWRSANSGCGSSPQVASSLRHAVVHHTAGGNDYSAAQVPGIILGMYRYHTGTKGWCDLAYNFVVDKFGTIWQGRSGDPAKPVVGGHAMGFNTGSVGVTLMGQFQPGASPAAAQPTAAMMDAAARVIAWKLSLHGLDPKGTVTLASAGNPKYAAGTKVTLPVVNYHAQSGQTSCPGTNVITKMGSLRDAVQRLMGSTTPPTDPPPTDPPPTDPPPTGRDWSPFSKVEDLVWREFTDFRRDPGTYADRRWWAVELDKGATNRNALVSTLARSPYVDERSTDAVRLYLAYFGRIPDHDGIRFWWGQMDGGMSLRSVSTRFSRSPEFRTMYGTLTDAAFVRLVYRNVLGREGTAADIDYWTGRIRSGRESRGGIMAFFAASAENVERSRTVTEVILIYEVMLGRAITPESHLQWVARVMEDGIGSLIGAIFSSAEYAARVA